MRTLDLLIKQTTRETIVIMLSRSQLVIIPASRFVLALFQRGLKKIVIVYEFKRLLRSINENKRKTKKKRYAELLELKG